MGQEGEAVLRAARQILIITAIAVCGAFECAFAAVTLGDEIRSELGKVFPGARIELSSEIRMIRGELPVKVKSIRFISDNLRGEAIFALQGENKQGVSVDTEVSAGFLAWTPAWIAARRILPGERLSPELFNLREVNVATGLPRELRGVILPKTVDVSQLEARQTVLEGQFAVTTGVRKVPDIRRGDAVRIHIRSGGLTVTTSGVSEEPAYYDSNLRVLTTKTKRELVGKLTKDGVVEVRL
jgi:flagella basal body P-ring formation protein FlgA